MFRVTHWAALQLAFIWFSLVWLVGRFCLCVCVYVIFVCFTFKFCFLGADGARAEGRSEGRGR